MKRIFVGLLVPVIVATGLAGSVSPAWSAEAAHWAYTGPNGPAKWGKLGKDFAACASGSAQAPIDIPDAAVRKGDLPPILFNYKPSALKIIDTGYTIQVDYAPDSWITVEGKRYELAAIDFHKPSEMKIDGKVHEMAAHLLHKSKDGKIAIVAVFLDPGKDNPLIKTLWSNLPTTREKEMVVDGVQISALGLLPQNKDYYTFAGSLTTPPCTENVTWYVLKTPTQVSAEEIARFARTYPMNARPVQALNARDIEGNR